MTGKVPPTTERDGVCGCWRRTSRRAVHIGKTINLKTVEAAALGDALDGLAAAMFLLDAAGSIVHANTAGHTLLEDGKVARRNRRATGTADSTADKALQAIVGAPKRAMLAVGAQGIAGAA